MNTNEAKDRLRNSARAAVFARMRFVTPALQRLGLYWPHAVDSDSYARTETRREPGTLPVPPRELWADYCSSAESYLESGREDVAALRRVVAESGAPVEGARRILELGCAAGRMVRWFADIADHCEIWGTDIWATAVFWCQDNLQPPFHFATTTAAPHLPFEERSFDLIYCGSVFTHIEELADAWFLELHRILRPGGHLYFTINDRNAVEIFEGADDYSPDEHQHFYERTGGRAPWDAFIAMIRSYPDYERFRSRAAYTVTMGHRSRMAHVMWDVDVLTGRLSYGFERLAIRPAAYGHQTVVLLRRLPDSAL